MSAALTMPQTEDAAPEAQADPIAAETPRETVRSIKGFNRDLTCRGFQFEVGQTYRVEGKVEACANGFHAIEGHPLEVFDYYPPARSVFHEVEQSGELARHHGDSKLASAEITIRAEISIPALVARVWDYVWSRATLESGSSATGHRGAASATGRYGSALASGIEASASGAEGCAIHLEERIWNHGEDAHGKIIAVWFGIVGQNGIKPGVFYRLVGGKPVEAAR